MYIEKGRRFKRGYRASIKQEAFIGGGGGGGEF